MPCYIYQIEESTTSMGKKRSMVNQYGHYKDGKRASRNRRSRRKKTENQQWKMVFADSELEAEELLQEQREAPVLMEWEK